MASKISYLSYTYLAGTYMMQHFFFDPIIRYDNNQTVHTNFFTHMENILRRSFYSILSVEMFSHCAFYYDKMSALKYDLCETAPTIFWYYHNNLEIVANIKTPKCASFQFVPCFLFWSRKLLMCIVSYFYIFQKSLRTASKCGNLMWHKKKD